MARRALLGLGARASSARPDAGSRARARRLPRAVARGREPLHHDLLQPQLPARGGALQARVQVPSL